MTSDTTRVTESRPDERRSWMYSPGLATAVLWAGVIIASAIVLNGTGYFGQLLPIYGGAFVVHLIVVEGVYERVRERRSDRS